MRRVHLSMLRMWVAGMTVAFLVLGIVGASLMAANGARPARAIGAVPRIVSFALRSPLGWAAAAALFVCFLLVRSVLRTGRRHGRRALFAAFVIRLVLPVAALWIAWYGLQHYRAEADVAWHMDPACENVSGRSQDRYAQDGKQRGVNLVMGRHLTEAQLAPLLRDNVEWLALGPFGWQENTTTTTVHWSPDDRSWSESDSGIVQIARFARAHAMHVMLKPQIWLGTRGHWLGDIDPGTEAGWLAWFASYRTFILHYAALAARGDVEVLCVGAELHRAVKLHPEAWRDLIQAVRGVYHGRLTYAANWNAEVADVKFWDGLDFIGVQAYYPLADHPSPSVEEMQRAWAPVRATLQALSARYGKPILFTEVGWKSAPDGAVRPWEWTERAGNLFARVSTRAQADAYEAFFRSLWHEPWFAGAYIWKWYGNHAEAGGPRSIDFTPQNKPAEAVLARWFATAP